MYTYYDEEHNYSIKKLLDFVLLKPILINTFLKQIVNKERSKLESLSELGCRHFPCETFVYNCSL